MNNNYKALLATLQSHGDDSNPRILREKTQTVSDERILKYMQPVRLENAPRWPIDMKIKATSVVASPEKSRIKAYNLSDLHVDADKNMDWVCSACVRDPQDADVFTVFIVPGDVGSDVERIRAVFESLVRQYDAVIYVPGNHEAWCLGKEALRTKSTDSVQKIAEVVSVAQACGVYTGPLRISTFSSHRALCIFPLYGWYHAGWDIEPDVAHPTWEAVEKALPFSTKWSDFSMCHWPIDLVQRSEWVSTAVGPDVPDNTVLAELFAGLNEPFLRPLTDPCATLQEAEAYFRTHSTRAPLIQPGDTVISFSHFIPRVELLPEKRFIMEPLLARVVGSDALEAQVQRLKPHLHLFGHSHIPIDLCLQGIQYVQWPVGYFREATEQCAVVRATGPLLCYDSELGTGPTGIPALASKDASWSYYYRNYEREPHVVGPLAPWAMQRLRQFDRAMQLPEAPPVVPPPSNLFSAVISHTASPGTATDSQNVSQNGPVPLYSPPAGLPVSPPVLKFRGASTAPNPNHNSLL